MLKIDRKLYLKIIDIISKCNLSEKTFERHGKYKRRNVKGITQW